MVSCCLKKEYFTSLSALIGLSLFNLSLIGLSLIGLSLISLSLIGPSLIGFFFAWIPFDDELLFKK